MSWCTSLLLLSMAILICILQDAEALTPSEECSMCQMSLFTVHAHFGGRVPSRRVFMSQFKHECKRLPNYRRRCLLLAKNFPSAVHAQMADQDFKPVTLCHQLKECKEYESPLRPDEMLFIPHGDSSPYPSYPEAVSVQSSMDSPSTLVASSSTIPPSTTEEPDRDATDPLRFLDFACIECIPKT